MDLLSRSWWVSFYNFNVSLTHGSHIQGSYTYKFQYAASEFGWTSEIVRDFRCGSHYRLLTRPVDGLLAQSDRRVSGILLDCNPTTSEYFALSYTFILTQFLLISLHQTSSIRLPTN